MFLKVVPKTLADLRQLANPEPVAGGQSEAVAWTFYDTALYTSAATTELVFFTTARATRQATNLGSPGQLPEPQYFEIGHFGMNIIVPPAATAWTDKSSLLNGGASGPPSWVFRLADKNYGPFPLLNLHAGGGIKGFGTQTSQAYANSGEPGSVGPAGGFQGGAIVIPPQQNFSITLNWDGAQTLAANRLIQVFMAGVLHRRVL